ncbi:FAD:protein FMN transferase [Streptococcus loxodontisalivarius]|uniref:FAD:protein FMN transferase n=1 Tax=Streptococcus loxodontisalivarius TaxID=1349415 RepID=A0ABS2PWP7_9STRE|nr:FAD:protein FMN transferase [Streptococcus loxodontisalivarius]MBM7643717.1 thiamine biosynthesis lipoprotein [Streptococcus loxodontisalivarius]
MALITETIEAMTIPFTISLVSDDIPSTRLLMAELLPKIKAELLRIEEKFSAFRKDSLVSRFQRGQKEPIFDPEFQEVYGQVIILKQRSQGYFDPYYKGVYDPTGFVKGWLIENIFHHFIEPLYQYDHIEAATFNGGGDIQASSRQGSDFRWQIGIENPKDLQQVLAIYPLSCGAIATSGTSKRGQHLTVLGQDDLLQVTVLSDSLAWADSWATALFSAGFSKAKELIQKEQLSALLVSQTSLFIFQNGQLHDQKAL